MPIIVSPIRPCAPLSPVASLGYVPPKRRTLPFLLLAGLAACTADPDARTTADEGKLTAKAVADVDAAMADAGTRPAAKR